jgi:hypothetical protein
MNDRDDRAEQRVKDDEKLIAELRKHANDQRRSIAQRADDNAAANQLQRRGSRVEAIAWLHRLNSRSPSSSSGWRTRRQAIATSHSATTVIVYWRCSSSVIVHVCRYITTTWIGTTERVGGRSSY